MPSALPWPPGVGVEPGGHVIDQVAGLLHGRRRRSCGVCWVGGSGRRSIPCDGVVSSAAAPDPVDQHDVVSTHTGEALWMSPLH